MKISIITPTHNPKWLRDTWYSLKNQPQNWEWIVSCNGPEAAAHAAKVTKLVESDPRVKVSVRAQPGGIGAIKGEAFMKGSGDLLVELDHDDMLSADALAEIEAAATEHPECGFFYSDCANFSADPSCFQGRDHTYMLPGKRAAWETNNWKFETATVKCGSYSGDYLYPVSFEPSALALSSILWSPNHVRVWRRSTYWTLGGHDARLEVADDHELMIRTYLATQMHHIPKVLYLYRCSGANTWAPRADEIRKLSDKFGADNLEALLFREAKLRDLPAYDLGGGKFPRAGWKTVDHGGDPDIKADLTHPWPFKTGSVFAFRASDLLEHLPDKMHTMSEIHRCLVPGGWLVSSTPSTDGRGAFQDPTHKSFWNENSFWYYTRDAQAQFIDNVDERFAAASLYTHFPSDWHKQHNISYVCAQLVALKPDYAGPKPQA